MNPFVSDGDNADITTERLNSNVNVDLLSEFYYGSKEKVEMRKEVEEYIKRHKELQDPIPTHFMTREEAISNAARKFTEMIKHDKMLDISDREKTAYFASLVHVRDTQPFSLHYVMFLPVLQSQADDEQLSEWLPKALSCSWNGTYAQTELGHGTNISKLETTATYDMATKQFVLHTPTASAAKWWPGNLGKFCNHAIVVALLYVSEECKGPHTFMVQIRDEETHEVLPNLKLGDIGPKYGINSADNGYLIFDKFRIPRRNMLMKFSKVLEDGTYVQPAHSKLAYGGMVFVRSMMVRDIANHLAISSTIATRYSSIRRQGNIAPNEKEVQILDYQSQQFRIFPQIAKSFAFHFAGEALRSQFETVTRQITKGNTQLLAELHALSSGLKAVVTFEVCQGIEQCRLSCGGHGYSQASAFPEIFAFSSGACTYEGDNIVLLLQVAKFLTKAMRGIEEFQDFKLADVCDYLKKSSQTHSHLSSYKSYTTDQLIQDFEHATRKQVLKAYNKLKLNEQKLSKTNAWNACSIELCKAARWHVKLFIVKTFLHNIQTAPAELKEVLHILSRLYAFDFQMSTTGNFLEDGYMNSEQVEEIKLGMCFYLSSLRSNAVSVVDSFKLSDIEMKSVLGRRDGNVYPALLEWAQNSSLNKVEVLPTFEKYLGPMMKHARSML